ncbi:hypothetical protein FRB96_005960 [Tulasnella sp. 330]|nr:hypothetical protein FRB96_005960 [Tulasnella sp. 330]
MSSGIPSPPLSPHGSPSSLTSDDFPSLSGSLYSFLTPESDYSSEDHENDHALGFSSHEHPTAGLDLILPSLGLASAGDQHADAYRRTSLTTPVGHAHDLGNFRVLVAGKHGAGKSLVCESLIAGAPQVLEVQPWSEKHEDGSKTLRAATTEKGRMNITITRTNGWDDTAQAQDVIDTLLGILYEPFRQASELLKDSVESSFEMMTLSSDLLSSPATPLYTAALVVLSASPTPTEIQLLRTLSQHVPTIPFSPHRPRRRQHSPCATSQPPHESRPQSRHTSRSEAPSRVPSRFHSRHASPHRYRKLAHSRAPSVPNHLHQLVEAPERLSGEGFHPTSHRALQEWVFDPKNLHALRRDAADKFSIWRERERNADPPTGTSESMSSSRTWLTQEDLPTARVQEDDPFSVFTFEQLLKGSQSDDEGQYPGVVPADNKQGAAIDGEDPLSTLRRRPGTRIMLDRYRATLASAQEQMLSPNITVPAPVIDELGTAAASSPCANSMASSDGFGVPHTRNHTDPLHFPSFLSLALSILPDLRRRIFSRIREVFVSSFSPSSESESLEAGTFPAANEKGLGTPQPERRLRLAKGVGPTVVVVSFAATMGFWVGYVVGGGGEGSRVFVMNFLGKVRNII